MTVALVGELKLRSILVALIAVALRPVGIAGATISGDVTVTKLLGADVPAELVAMTTKVSVPPRLGIVTDCTVAGTVATTAKFELPDSARRTTYPEAVSDGFQPSKIVPASAPVPAIRKIIKRIKERHQLNEAAVQNRDVRRNWKAALLDALHAVENDRVPADARIAVVLDDGDKRFLTAVAQEQIRARNRNGVRRTELMVHGTNRAFRFPGGAGGRSTGVVVTEAKVSGPSV